MYFYVSLFLFCLSHTQAPRNNDDDKDRTIMTTSSTFSWTGINEKSSNNNNKAWQTKHGDDG
jgi:hypothetical protein